MFVKKNVNVFIYIYLNWKRCVLTHIGERLSSDNFYFKFDSFPIIYWFSNLATNELNQSFIIRQGVTINEIRKLYPIL